MGVRIVTDKALDAWLAQHQMRDAARIADAIEALPYEVCTHNDRPSCAKCARRLTVQAAAAVVRETGGAK